MGELETEIGEGNIAKKVKKENTTKRNPSFLLHPSDKCRRTKFIKNPKRESARGGEREDSEPLFF